MKINGFRNGFKRKLDLKENNMLLYKLMSMEECFTITSIKFT